MLSDAGDRRLPAPTMDTTTSVEGETERCPRCGSHNTKFCYYNNYSLAQPRHFCKACRRYWTVGGSLRNIPIGGSTRSGSGSNSSHNHQKHHHSSSLSASSAKRLRHAEVLARVPSSASASPLASSSLSSPPMPLPGFDATAIFPISASPKAYPANIVDSSVSMDMVGSLISLITEPFHTAFLPLGGRYIHGHDDGLGLGLGLGEGFKWLADEMGFGTARPAPAWPFLAEDDDSGLTGFGNAGDSGRRAC